MRTLLLAGCLAAVCSCALAQGRGGAGPMGGGMGGPPGGSLGGGPGGMPGGRPMGNPGGVPQVQGGQRTSTQRASGLQLGPPGQRWWDDKSVARNLKLKPEQQTRMDAIFEENRNVLLTRFQDLQQAEAHMDELTKGAVLDEPALFAQIDRIAEARAALAKASTHMFLQIRNEMNPDQITRLDKSQ